MQPVMIRVASFNVGSEDDWYTLFSRARWKEKENKEFTSAGDIKAQREALRTFETAQGITKDKACQGFSEKAYTYLGRLLREFDPHIICLQEYVFLEKLKQANAHFPIKTFLESSGYVIVGDAKRAIAYKKDDFECMKSGAAFTEDVQVPALFADLKHQSGIVIRAVSDHLRGFDAVAQKSGKKEKLKLPQGYEDRAKILEKNPRTVHGDIALDRSLNSLEKDNDPDVIVYGLDANSTSKQSSREKSERLHPKRMRLFEIYKYQMDHANQAPTCLDANDWQLRKYDYICAKSLDAKREIRIKDQILSEVNHPKLLREPGLVMSDHLPVLSTLTITKLKSDGCAVS